MSNSGASMVSGKPLPKLVFGVDLDGVVGDYNAGFRKSVAAIKDLDPELMEDPTEWNFATARGWEISDREEYLALHKAAVVQHHLFANLPIYKGASENLWKLSNAGVRIKIVTHRLITKGDHGIVVADTVEWLEKYNIPYSDLCFVMDKTVTGADVYVDDAPHNISAIKETLGDGKVIIFNQLYNQDLSGERVSNWDQLADKVLDIQLAGNYHTE